MRSVPYRNVLPSLFIDLQFIEAHYSNHRPFELEVKHLDTYEEKYGFEICTRIKSFKYDSMNNRL